MSRIDQIREMLREDPDDAFLLYALALEQEKAGDLQQACEGLERLRQQQADYLPVYYKLGKLCEQLGRHTAAIGYYKTGMAVAKTQGDQKALGELAEALLFLEDEE